MFFTSTDHTSALFQHTGFNLDMCVIMEQLRHSDVPVSGKSNELVSGMMWTHADGFDQTGTSAGTQRSAPE